MITLVSDPAINKLSLAEDYQPYSHIRSVIVPRAGHWIHCEFPELLVDEALKIVAELE